MEDGASYEMETLPPAPRQHNLRWTRPRLSRRRRAGRLAAGLLVFLLPSAIVALLITFSRSRSPVGDVHDVIPWPSTPNLVLGGTPLIPFPSCGRKCQATNETYMFFPRSWLTITEEIGIENFQGKVHFAPARPYQGGIPVFATLLSSYEHQEDYDRIRIDQSVESPDGTSSLRIGLSDPWNKRPFRGCVTINLVVQAYRRNYFNTLRVSTQRMDIEMGIGARFDTENVQLISGFGDIASARAYDYDTDDYAVF